MCVHYVMSATKKRTPPPVMFKHYPPDYDKEDEEEDDEDDEDDEYRHPHYVRGLYVAPPRDPLHHKDEPAVPLPVDALSTLHTQLRTANLHVTARGFVTAISKVLSMYTDIMEKKRKSCSIMDTKQEPCNLHQYVMMMQPTMLPFCSDVLKMIASYLRTPGFPANAKRNFEVSWTVERLRYHGRSVRLVRRGDKDFRSIQHKVNQRGRVVTRKLVLAQLEKMESRTYAAEYEDESEIRDQYKEYVNMLRHVRIFAEASSKITSANIGDKFERMALHFSAVDSYFLIEYSYTSEDA